MGGIGATTTTNSGDTEIKKSLGVMSHVLRRAQIDNPIAHILGEPCIRLHRQWRLRRFRETLDNAKHHLRPKTAIGAHDIGTHVRQFASDLLRTGSQRCVAIITKGHLSDDGAIRVQRSNGRIGLSDLTKVDKGLEQEQIHSTVEKTFRLLFEMRKSFFLRDGSKRGDGLAKGTDGTGHECLTRGFLASKAGTFLVDALDEVRETMGPQLHAIGTVGVGLDEINANINILTVHRLNQCRIREIELVVAAIEKNALAIEHRSHGTVTDDRTIPETCQQFLSIHTWS